MQIDGTIPTKNDNISKSELSDLLDLKGLPLHKCKYCGKESINCGMYIIRRATKPKSNPNRWVTIGYCCEECYENSPKKLQFEYGEKVI